MTKKIFKSIFISCFAVLVSAIVIVFCVLYNFYGNELMNELHTEVNTVFAGVEQSGESYLDNLELDDNKRITWINSDGTVRYDTYASVDEMENHLNREEVKKQFQAVREKL